MKNKNNDQIWEQYVRLLKNAFPKLKFSGNTWNWYKVYNIDPHNNSRFMLIFNAYRNTIKQNV